MSIEFKLDMRDFNRSMNKYADDSERELRIASKRSASIVEEVAKKEHRFTTRTGRLVKSIKGTGNASQVGGIFQKAKKLISGKTDIGAFVELKLLDEGSPLGTEYGKYVHNGQRSWGADKFIEKAIEKNERIIFSNWQKAVDTANKRF